MSDHTQEPADEVLMQHAPFTHITPKTQENTESPAAPAPGPEANALAARRARRALELAETEPDGTAAAYAPCETVPTSRNTRAADR